MNKIDMALQSLIEDLTLNHEYCPKETILDAAAELRRLHEENETLKKCLFQMQNAAIELAKPEQEPQFALVGEIRSSVWAGHNWAHHFNAAAKLDFKTKLYIKLEKDNE